MALLWSEMELETLYRKRQELESKLNWQPPEQESQSVELEPELLEPQEPELEGLHELELGESLMVLE